LFDIYFSSLELIGLAKTGYNNLIDHDFVD